MEDNLAVMKFSYILWCTLDLVPAPGLDWANAHFLRYPHIYNLATDPRILAIVKVCLWMLNLTQKRASAE